jgi:cation:H+ antiporter
LDFLLIIAGLAALLFGGEMLVRGAVALAGALRISPMIIGLTVVGFGTSSPELLTSLQAAFAGSPGIAVGNVVGSNLGNILLILGITAVLAPITVHPAMLRRDGSVMAAASVLCLVAVLGGELGRIAGGGLFAALILYLVLTIWYERRHQTPATELYLQEAETLPNLETKWSKGLLIFAVGLAITLLGARLLVTGAISVATLLGLSESVIGLTIVAIGTSMPELVTSLIAARKGHGDVALGNVIGSNIFNILGILGVTSLVHPLTVPASIAQFDIWVMLAATGVLLFFARTGWRIGRREGIALLASYIAYIGWLLLV